MKTLAIVCICTMLAASAAFAAAPYNGYTRRDAMQPTPYYGAGPNVPRNDNGPAQGNSSQTTDKQKRKNPDPYDSKYDTQYNRPRY